jgi:hypothetical protein
VFFVCLAAAAAAVRSVLLALPTDGKRLFLQFCTGCDRAPIAGLAALKLLVQVGGRHVASN